MNNELAKGAVVGDTERTVVFCTEMDGHYVAICRKDDAYHPFVVWNVYKTDNGWRAMSGQYCFHLHEALNYYKARGGR